jgi:hypothetical protein
VLGILGFVVKGATPYGHHFNTEIKVHSEISPMHQGRIQGPQKKLQTWRNTESGGKEESSAVPDVLFDVMFDDHGKDQQAPELAWEFKRSGRALPKNLGSLQACKEECSLHGIGEIT